MLADVGCHVLFMPPVEEVYPKAHKMPELLDFGLPDEDQLPPMKVRLRAGASGQIAQISLNENSFSPSFTRLHDFIMGIIGDERGPGSVQDTAEVELDCDYNLRYEHVIEAITAVSGYVDDDGNIVKLVEKIKFSPPRTPGS